MSQEVKSPFEFFGVYTHPVSGSSDQHVGDCLFCGKANHFFVKLNAEKKYPWQCKRCTRSGNLYTFFYHYHSLCLKTTKTSDYKELSALRGNIPYKVFADANLARDTSGECRWIIPIPSLKAKGQLDLGSQSSSSNEEAPPITSLASLRIWTGPGQHMLSPSDTKLQLYRGNLLSQTDLNVPVYICEGEWDALALEWARQKLRRPGLILAVPGAGTFKETWVEALQGREVFLCFDNDNAGANGMDRTAKLLHGKARSVSRIEWPANLKEGYDVQDWISSSLRNPAKAWDTMHKMLHVVGGTNGKTPTPVAAAKYKTPPTFKTVVNTFRKYGIHLDANMEHCLGVVLATTLSIQLPGDPIWVFLVGPPGSGKTLMLRSLEDSDHCLFQSSLSPRALCSGYRGEDGQDPSLLSHLPGKCLVLKDYTEIKSMPLASQEEIYGVLRGAYDGKVERSYANGVVRVYDNCWFSMVAGVTHIIHGDHRATLGERFLKVEFVREGYDPNEHIRAAISGMTRQIEAETELKAVVSAFLSRDLSSVKFAKLPAWFVSRLTALSQFIAYLRAGVERNWSKDLVYRPRVEVGTRLSKQLVKLAQCLSYVFNPNQTSVAVNEKVYAIVQRVAFDTAIGWNLEVMAALLTSKKPLSRVYLSERLNMGMGTLQKKLEDLLELGAVERVREETTHPGQPAFLWKPSPALAKLWAQAKVSIPVVPKPKRSR